MSSEGTVLVTGGAGFIGVNLARVLVERGWTPIAYDNGSTGRLGDAVAAGFADVIEGDVRDTDALRSAASSVDAIVHLAAQAGVPSSIADPVADCDLNVRGTLNALIAARDTGVSGFVFASSNAPLGEIEPPAHEQVVPRPLSPYGASKLAGEAYCSAFAASYGVPAVVLRFANVYGPFSYHKGSVVATFMKAVMEGRPITVNGDGTQTRDFVYVADLCDGIVRSLESGLGGETFHLGTGSETSVNDLVGCIRASFTGREVSVEHGPALTGEIQRNCADIAKARRLLGYQPAVGLEDGLAATREWFETWLR
ncbi:MAG: NAD-dependent epimerase/dehydratase family protein [Acidimicrobiales bacterium]|nr:NAD-dependent epimerase/dehydratase family protein [Acidimicrobiales bacterium]